MPQAIRTLFVLGIKAWSPYLCNGLDHAANVQWRGGWVNPISTEDPMAGGLAMEEATLNFLERFRFRSLRQKELRCNHNGKNK